MAEFALEINSLKKVYNNNVVALKGIDLKVKKGDFYALLGPNGAGKSSTIGIIGSLVTKTGGKVSVFGNDIDKDLNGAKSMLGVVSQEINFSQFEKVLDIVVTQAGFYGIPKSIAMPRVEDILKRLSLWDRRNVQARTLSGGYKRRLMIAKALIHEPKLLILDEPTAGVSPIVMDELFDHIVKVKRTNVAILMVEQNAKQALNISDRGYVLVTGENRYSGTGQELLNNPEVRRSFLGG